jgi:pyridoxamine 5'-phosphate oxidase
MKNASQLASLRVEYTREKLEKGSVHPDPIVQFEYWFSEVVQAEVPLANAFSLASCSGGRPSVRIVLLKDFEEGGFVFFTNYQSRKGRELEENPYAAITFFWIELERQVRIEGKVERISEADSEAYFITRDPLSRIGAWASPQSEVIGGRGELEARFREVEDRFKAVEEVPRPPHWGGYRLVPDHMEFWQGRESRLHDRILYSLREDGSWKIERLAP